MEYVHTCAPPRDETTRPQSLWICAACGSVWEAAPDGRRVKNYYVNESVGIATGILVTALHHAGLATLTHTPSPMKFLNEVLGRPDNERPFLVLVVGHPAEGATVPDIRKKPLEEIALFFE